MSISNLSHQKCAPCEGGTQPLKGEELQVYLDSVDSGWKLDATKKKISKQWSLKNFRSALRFINDVGAIAEQERHHPDLHLTDFKYVTVEVWTHAIGGLSVNDFIVAAKIDKLNTEGKV